MRRRPTIERLEPRLTLDAGALLISEFMALNDDGLRDADGDYSDWIEIYNPGDTPVDLGGWHLTDDRVELTKWTFPSVQIPPDGYQVVFASDKNRIDPAELHTNFRLAGAGEDLALVAPDGQTISHAYWDYPPQEADVSYGLDPTTGADLGEQYMPVPTPGRVNTPGFLGIVADTKFSIDRGFYETPQVLEISTATADALIRYTVDGSQPTETRGRPYTGPITIDGTTVVRAVAFKSGYQPTNVDTHTYIFLDDVIRQDVDATLQAGLPASWGGTLPDYGMDPDVIGTFDSSGNASGDDLFNGVYAASIRNDLQAIPTLSLVTGVNEMFGPNGIYSNPTQRGNSWERPTSVELIYADGSEGFQVDSGVKIHGGAFRSHSLTKKHSLRLVFKDDYGPTKLRFPLFGADAADRFDTITLRSEANDGWQWEAADGQAQYARDEFARRAGRAMGQVASHGTRVHLYINGIYWGLYNPVERPDASFAATYFGGDKDEWDAINSGEAIDGDLAAWNQMKALAADVAVAPTEAERTAAFMKIQGLQPDGTDNPAWEDYLDVDNMIDYLIVNFYIGNADWPHKNYFVARRDDPESTGFKFFLWDSEWSLGLNSSVTADRTGVSLGVAEPYANLLRSEEFRLQFADRVQRHFFNEGALYVDSDAPSWDPAHPERNVPAARYMQVIDEIDEAIVAESARWGDQHRDQPYTRDAEWQAELDDLLTEYFPQRSVNVLEDFRRVGLYPTLPAPEFNQHGGRVPIGFALTMQVDAAPSVEETVLLGQGDAIQYFVPTDDSLGTAWAAAGFDERDWTSGTNGIGYEDASDDYADLIETRVRPRDIDPMATSVLLRIPFEASNVRSADRLTLRMKYDDGFIAYLDGQEIARRNVGGAVGWNSTAVIHPDQQALEFEEIDISNYMGTLHEGTGNYLAIRVVNSSPNSSDLLGLPELVIGSTTSNGNSSPLYFTTDGSDPRAIGGGISTRAIMFEDVGILLDEGTVVKARSLQDGQWSALSEAHFVVDVPASAENLAVTEIHFNPHDPTAVESAAYPGVDNDDFEFLELRNVGEAPIDLSGLRFTDGIGFAFDASASITLAPSRSVVLASNTAAFQIRYGSDVDVAGQYAGRLSNGGERIRLEDTDGHTIADFRYDDDLWPDRADGDGASMELVNPASTPVDESSRTAYLEDADNWRPSGQFGGSPGTAGEGPRRDVLINEVLSRTTPGQHDAIELVNTTDASIDVGGWYLSDSSSDYRKFRIPDGTHIAAGGYLVFDESHFNPDAVPTRPGFFGLSGTHGDDVWLMEADPNGTLTRFVDGVEFSAAAEGETFGRWPDADGALYPMREATLGTKNSGPRVGPVVISEVMYHPPDPGNGADASELAFVEIHNPTASPVDISHWQLRGGIAFDFEAATVLGAEGSLVVVPFDPNAAEKLATFRDYYGLDSDVSILGGYSGTLDDNQQRTIRLLRPDEPSPGEPGDIPWLLEDEMQFASVTPWPVEADGSGRALSRRTALAFGNAAASWEAAAPTPGVFFTQDDAYEPNDSWSEAFVSAGPWQSTLLSMIDGPAIQADDDFYRIEPENNARRLVVDLFFSHIEGDLDMAIIDLQGKVHALAASATDDEHMDVVLPPSAAYYLSVFGQNIGTEYDLRHSSQYVHPADANLDEWTDVADFNIWNAAKFTTETDWSTGDFNGDGITDISDFNIWNAAKFTTSPAAAPVAPTLRSSGSSEAANSPAASAELASLYGYVLSQVDGVKPSTEAAVDRVLADYWFTPW